MTQEFWKVVFMAVLQGVTEFLPVSSSGHLVLAGKMLGVEAPGAFLEVALHVGTLFSILLYYRKRLAALLLNCLRCEKGALLHIWKILCGFLPAGVTYILFGDMIEEFFDSASCTAIMLCVTGVILLSVRFARRTEVELTVWRGILIGLAQAFAMMPGISRSGTTIAAARHLGIRAGESAEYSLMIVIPALAGAALIHILKLGTADPGNISFSHLAVAVPVSALVGYISIVALVRVLSAGRFWIFGIYCLVAGALGLLLM